MQTFKIISKPITSVGHFGAHLAIISRSSGAHPRTVKSRAKAIGAWSENHLVCSWRSAEDQVILIRWRPYKITWTPYTVIWRPYKIICSPHKNLWNQYHHTCVCSSCLSLYIACSLVLLLFTSLLVSRSFHLSPPFPLFYTSSSSSSVYLSPIRSFLAQSCFALLSLPLCFCISLYLSPSQP